MTVSPSLAEVLRVCPLRGLLARAPGVDDYLLGNPKAWLGTAYHAVLERAARGSYDLNSSDPVGRLWADAIERIYTAASAHPLNKRFGTPERWPGYYLALAGVRLRVTELSTAKKPRPATTAPSEVVNAPVRERRFGAFDGKLVGQPDLVEGNTIVDYKSGAIFDDTVDGPSIKAGYARQLRIYGFLVGTSLGKWPTRGVLLPMLGAKAEIELTRDECRAEAENAVNLLDITNRRLATAREPSQLASPSADACGRCPYRIMCSAYWDSVSPAFAADKRYGDAEGVMLADAERVHGGGAYALRISVERGSVASGANVVSPLASSVHENAELCHLGTRVRIIGLCVRHNAQLAPTLHTVVQRCSGIPALKIDLGAVGG